MRARVRIPLGLLVMVAGGINTFYTLTPAQTSSGYLKMFIAGLVVFLIGFFVAMGSPFKESSLWADD